MVCLFKEIKKKYFIAAMTTLDELGSNSGDAVAVFQLGAVPPSPPQQMIVLKETFSNWGARAWPFD